MTNNNQNQMMTILMNDYETKQFMKNKFYSLKIQEAKDKKLVIPKTGFFEWDALPSEIEKMILDYKYDIELVYLPIVMKENKIYNKILSSWLTASLRHIPNMHIPKINNDNCVEIVRDIINKKGLFDFAKKQTEEVKMYNKLYLDYLDSSQDKTLTLNNIIAFSSIVYNKKKEESKKKIQIDTGLKIGDVIFLHRDVSVNKHFNRNKFYNIIGETKNMWKVKQANETIVKDHRTLGNYWRKITYTYVDERAFGCMSFNISKHQIWEAHKCIEFKDLF